MSVRDELRWQMQRHLEDFTPATVYPFELLELRRRSRLRRRRVAGLAAVAFAVLAGSATIDGSPFATTDRATPTATIRPGGAAILGQPTALPGPASNARIALTPNLGVGSSWQEMARAAVECGAPATVAAGRLVVVVPDDRERSFRSCVAARTTGRALVTPQNTNTEQGRTSSSAPRVTAAPATARPTPSRA